MIYKGSTVAHQRLYQLCTIYNSSLKKRSMPIAHGNFEHALSTAAVKQMGAGVFEELLAEFSRFKPPVVCTSPAAHDDEQVRLSHHIGVFFVSAVLMCTGLIMNGIERVYAVDIRTCRGPLRVCVSVHMITAVLPSYMHANSISQAALSRLPWHKSRASSDADRPTENGPSRQEKYLDAEAPEISSRTDHQLLKDAVMASDAILRTIFKGQAELHVCICPCMHARTYLLMHGCMRIRPMSNI